MWDDYRSLGCWDELLVDGEPRTACEGVVRYLISLGDELSGRQEAAELAIRSMGITFTVYGEEQGTERVFPYDVVPRVISNTEWTHIERGLVQRITALNMFLHDVYNEGRILAEGKVPREVVYTCRHFRREMRGLQVPRNIYIAVSGTDLLRVQSGEFVVLEDNLRVPSGVSYMLTSRRVMKRIFPQLFRAYDVRPIEHYSQVLLATLRSLAPEGRPEPTIVVLTPETGSGDSSEPAAG